MDKRGDLSAPWMIFGVGAAIIFFVFGNTFIDDAFAGTLYDNEFIAKDLEIILINSCLIGEDDLFLDYRLDVEGMKINTIRENNLIIFEVERGGKKAFFELEDDFCFSGIDKLRERPIDAYTLEIIKEGKNLILDTKESFGDFELEEVEKNTIKDISLEWPVSSRVVTSCYGERKCEGCSDVHKGIDIRASIGTPVKAMFDGKVKEINNAWGSVLVLQKVNNQELTIKYLHLSEIGVDFNDNVKKGDVIGLSGDKVPFGKVDPHLHVQTRINDKHFDPLEILDAGGLDYSRSANCAYNSASYDYQEDIRNNLVD